MCLLSFLKWGSIGYSLGVVQWDFTRRDHPGNPGRVSGSGPVIRPTVIDVEEIGVHMSVGKKPAWKNHRTSMGRNLWGRPILKTDTIGKNCLTNPSSFPA